MTGGADVGGVDALSLVGVQALSLVGVQDLSLVGDVSCCPEAAWASAANSRASLDCLPTLAKGLMTLEEDEVASGSTLSLFRELDL